MTIRRLRARILLATRSFRMRHRVSLQGCRVMWRARKLMVICRTLHQWSALCARVYISGNLSLLVNSIYSMTNDSLVKTSRLIDVPEQHKRYNSFSAANGTGSIAGAQTEHIPIASGAATDRTFFFLGLSPTAPIRQPPSTHLASKTTTGPSTRPHRHRGF